MKVTLSFKFYVYNGIRFFCIEVNSEKVGYRLGEFAPTKKKPIPKKKALHNICKSATIIFDKPFTGNKGAIFN
jgi:ribosomal protein S19